MGEVYRARDPRLGREVAIKVLPGNLSMDAERMRRFELEAKAVGALSHPNLLAVFDTGQHEGAPFVVFELLDGATLRVRLGGKPLATTQALDYATQIARGLPAAHEKGIVHRDLKPENLFVTRDGRVKILDFGLAKLRPPLDPGAVAADTPTASAMTEAGTILGTVGYMSPEQVRRSQVDHRSDIFSFGAVLYEMLSGRRAFQRETDAEVMTAILKAGPAALAEANPTVPRGLERIVKHCLEKRPEDRFQTARDLVFALESVAAGSGGVAVNGVSAARRRWLLPVVSAGLLGLAIGLGSAFLRQPWGPRSLAFNQVTFRRGMIAEARFAPDGQTVVYGAAVEGHHNRLFSARLGSAEVRALDLPEGDIGGINRSGEMAILLARSYVGRHGILALASLAGGAVRERLEDVSAADWGPDGTTLAVIRQEKTRNRIEFPIGNVLYESPNGISALRVSRTGDRIAFLEGEEPDHGLLRVVDLARKVTTLTSTDGSYGLAWSPKGSEVWFSEWGILRAVTLSGGKRVLTRFPGPITINDVTDDGRVLVTTAQWYQHLMFAGPADTKERDLGWFEGASSAALSHDGKTLLFHDRGRGTGSPDPPNVYLRRTDGSPAVRLGEGIPMALSPDGKWAMTRPSGRPWHCVLVPTGPGESRPLPTDDLECACASWFPDGKRVVVTGVSAGKTWRVYIQDVQGGTRRPLTPEGFSLGFPAYEPSPDGKQVLASTTDGPGRHVVFPVDGGQPKPVTGLGPREVSAGWSADSQSLYVYAVEADLPVTIDKLDLGSGRRERFKTLSPADMSAFAGIFNGRVTPDGRAYAYTSGQYPCILYVIEGLR